MENINFQLFRISLSSWDIKDLLTEREVCTGKYLPEVFVQTERRRSEVYAKKHKENIFPYRPSKRG